MNMLLKILVLLLILAPAQSAFAADAGAAKESTYDRVMRTHTLRCGYFTWSPYMAKDSNTGAFSGLYYDVIEQMGKVLGLKIEWAYEYTFGQQAEVLRTGKADALCADGPWTRSAMPFVDYSHPYLFIPGFIYVAKDNPKKPTLETLNAPEMSFAAIDGDGSAEYLEMLFPKAKVMDLPATGDAAQQVQNVLTGKSDAMFNDPMTVNAYAAEDRAKLQQLGDAPIATLPFAISVDKGQQDLLNTLNQGIDLLSDTGMLDRIIAKYDPVGDKAAIPEKRYVYKQIKQ